MKKKSFPLRFKTAEEMDEYLENADLSEIMKEKGVVKPAIMKKINLDLPPTMVLEIDRIASKIGIARQPLLKIWIHERLKIESSK